MFSAFDAVLGTGNRAMNKIKPPFSWNLHFSRVGVGGEGARGEWIIGKEEGVVGKNLPVRGAAK